MKRETAVTVLAVMLAMTSGAVAKPKSLSLKPVSQNPGLYKAEVVDKPVLALESQVLECGTPAAGKQMPTLQIGIAPDGTVSKVTIKPATGFTQDMIDCVTKVVKTATFPARPKSKGTTASFAMVYWKR